MPFPFILANGAGSWPDADKYMGNWDYLFAMAKGNFLQGPGFESWTVAGTSISNPADGATLSDGWLMSKGGTSAATADVARESTTKDSGSYSMKVNITGAGSSNSYVRPKQSVSNFIRFAGKSVVFSAKVYAGTASKVRLSVYDGVTTAYSSYHTGDSTWQKLSVALACSDSITELTVKVEITSDFTGAVYIDSSFLYVTQATISSDAIAALEYFGPDDPLSLLIGTLTVLANATIAGTLGMSNAINEAKGADIASASTVNLDTATGNLVDVTGTTTITAITLSVGRERVVRFTGALTLTHGSSLLLPTAANITTVAGDFAIFRGYASGVVRCVAYVPVDGTPVAGIASQADQETGTSLVKTVSPGRQHLHPSAAKVWVKFDGTGTPAVTVSRNVSSITDNGVGDWTVNFTTSFSSADYAVAGLCGSTSAPETGTFVIVCGKKNTAPAAGSIRISVAYEAWAVADIKNVCIACFGDQ